MLNEASARIKINKLLEDAGWFFFDKDGGAGNILLEQNVKLSGDKIKSLGDDFEKTEKGFIDFLLLDENGHPFVVLEAKSSSKDPLIGKEQARKYARSVYCRYIILSNGNIHYFWDIERGNPQLIMSFPSYEELRECKVIGSDPTRLYSEEVAEDYIAVVKNLDYARAIEYKNSDTRAKYLTDNGLRMLRPYQVRAVKALQKSVSAGGTRFLFNMI